MKKLASLLLLASSICFGQDLELLISPEEISQKITQTAQEIDTQYQGEEIALIIVMKGGVCIGADLMRAIKTPFTLAYMKASSYGQNGTKSGELTITGLDGLNLEGKNLLVVDDIFDSGKTMSGVVEKLKAANPKSLRTVVLLSKNIPRQVTYKPDYELFTIEDRFVVGYGLDYKEHFRGLPGVYAFVNDTPPKGL